MTRICATNDCNKPAQGRRYCSNCTLKKVVKRQQEQNLTCKICGRKPEGTVKIIETYMRCSTCNNWLLRNPDKTEDDLRKSHRENPEMHTAGGGKHRETPTTTRLPTVAEIERAKTRGKLTSTQLARMQAIAPDVHRYIMARRAQLQPARATA